MFGPATVPETSHSITAYYATTAFVFAAVTVYQLIKKGKQEGFGPSYQFRKKIVGILLIIATIFAVGVTITGDNSARFDSRYEPEKFAAAEAIPHTTNDAPFIFGGRLDDDSRPELHDDIEVPELLSYLVGGSRDTVVRGLDSFDPATWPPFIVHDFFDVMALVGVLMLLTPILFFALWHWHHLDKIGKPMEWLIIFTGICSLIAVEVGWMLTEFGRQPYVIKGIMPSSDAFNVTHATILYAIWFPIAYIILAIVTYKVLTRHYRKTV